MLENLAIYLPNAEIDFSKDFPESQYIAAADGEDARYEIPTPQGTLTLRLMLVDAHSEHLQGFTGYVSQLPAPHAAIEEATRRIAESRLVVGVVPPAPIDREGALMARLWEIAAAHDGFMFYDDSVMVDGEVLVGRGGDSGVRRQAADGVRAASLDALEAKGFTCAPHLPKGLRASLRSKEDIAYRLAALTALVYYVAAPDDQISTEEVAAIIERDKLRPHLTPSELEILDLERDEARDLHLDQIGWRFENMWPLAWALGFKPTPDVDGDMLQGPFMFEMMALLDLRRHAVADRLPGLSLRPTKDVVALEDLFYCAHNAVRSAQLGGATVPENFDPIANGGVVHERRHALTWMLSPGVSWDDTDLGT